MDPLKEHRAQHRIQDAKSAALRAAQGMRDLGAKLTCVRAIASFRAARGSRSAVAEAPCAVRRDRTVLLYHARTAAAVPPRTDGAPWRRPRRRAPDDRRGGAGHAAPQRASYIHEPCPDFTRGGAP